MSDRTIRVKYSPSNDFWFASFGDAPHSQCAGERPMLAAERLLMLHLPPEGRYLIVVDLKPPETGRSPIEGIWDPPELLFECLECQGSGEISSDGAAKCPRCEGLGVVNA